MTSRAHYTSSTLASSVSSYFCWMLMKDLSRLVFAAPWSACLFGPVTSLHLPADSSYLFWHIFFFWCCLMKQPGQRGGRISRYDWSSQVSGKKTPTAGCTTCFYWAGRKRKVHAGLLGIRSVGQMTGLAWVQQKMTNSSTKINRSFVIKKNFTCFLPCCIELELRKPYA